MSKSKFVIPALCSLAGYLLYPSILGKQGAWSDLVHEPETSVRGEEGIVDGEVERNLPEPEMLEKIIISDYPEYCQMHRPGVVTTSEGTVAIDIGAKLKPLSVDGRGLMVEVLDSDVSGKVPISVTNFMKLTMPQTLARLNKEQ